MKMRTIAMALISMLVLAAGAEAQVPRLWHIGFAGGMSLPVSDAKDALKNGFHGQGFFSVDVPHVPLGVRAGLDYERFDLKGLGTGASGTGTLLGGMANGLWHFPAGPAKPYITAGLGAFNVKSEIDSSGASTSASKVHFAVNAGAGLELKLGSISGFIEGRIQNIFTEKGLNAGFASTDKVRTQVIPISVGLIF